MGQVGVGFSEADSSRIEDTAQKITPEQARSILQEHGMEVTLEQAESILTFLRRLASIANSNHGRDV